MSDPIYPCLWFDGRAKEAVTFYCSIFTDTEIIDENNLVVTFKLRGQKFMALNGGPQFKFNEAVSFVVTCENQKEIDFYWEKLSAGGEESQCGWLKDKFGLSWQIVPSIMGELMNEEEKAKRVTNAFMKMGKLDIEILIKASMNQKE